MTATVTEGNVTHLPDPASDDAIILQALKILETRSRAPEWYVQNADEVKNYLRVRLAAEHGRECLFALYLDARYGVVAAEVMQQGALDAETFQLRFVVQQALVCNATAVVFAHNQPPGGEAWSQADQQLSLRPVNALAPVGMRVLDYFLVGGELDVYSFSERGRL
jgi:DNA repair protein RadC